MTTVSPAKLVKCQSRPVSMADIKMLMRAVPSAKLRERIKRIDDPFVREEAEKLERAAYVA